MQTQEKQIVSISDNAVHRIREIMQKADHDIVGLRVSINNKGCSGHSYQVEYAKDKRQFEEEIIQDDVRLFIDPAAVMFLIGSVVDYQKDKFQSGFTFINPNEKSRCGCGESFSV